MLALVWVNFFLAFVTLCVGRFFGRYAISKVWGCVVGSCVSYSGLQMMVLMSGSVPEVSLVTYGTWFQVAEVVVEWAFSIDKLTMLSGGGCYTG